MANDGEDWHQSFVGKKMATGTSTHNSKRTKIFTTLKQTYGRFIKSLNLGYTINLVQGGIL